MLQKDFEMPSCSYPILQNSDAIFTVPQAANAKQEGMIGNAAIRCYATKIAYNKQKSSNENNPKVKKAMLLSCFS